MIGLPLVFAGTVLLLLHVLDPHYPVHQWLFWRYLGYWVLAVTCGFSWLAAGHTLLSRAGYARVPLREHLLFSQAVGLFVFTTGIFLAGIAGFLSSGFAFSWPLMLLAVGARDSFRFGRRVLRHIRRVRRRLVPRPGFVRVLASG